MFQTLSFRVQAVSDDNQRKSEALVLLMVKDINDHTPIFSEQVKKISFPTYLSYIKIIIIINKKIDFQDFCTWIYFEGFKSK